MRNSTEQKKNNFKFIFCIQIFLSCEQFVFFLLNVIGTAYAGPSVSGCTGTETDKQIGMWERRMRGLRRMLLGWEQTKPPDPPNFIGIDVTSPTSASIRIQESGDGPIATKFKGKLFAMNCHNLLIWCSFLIVTYSRFLTRTDLKTY